MRAHASTRHSLRGQVAVLVALLTGLGHGALHIDATNAVAGAACVGTGEITGRVVDLPFAQDSLWRFAFAIQDAPAAAVGGVRPPLAERCRGAMVRLTWHGVEQVAPGQRWRLVARLRAPHGTVNDGVFDAEQWHRRAGIVAIGYVLEGELLDAEATGWEHVDRLRDGIRHRIEGLGLAHADVIRALTVGDGAALGPEAKGRYRRTGTMHLLVISGLHVGLVAALGFLLGRAIAFVLGGPAIVLGALGALSLSGTYVLLGGSGLSLVRAFVMSAAALSGMLAGRAARPMRVYALAMAAVLALDPMAPLDAGFWLSFAAVGALLAFFAPRQLVAELGEPGWRRGGLGESWVGSAVRVQVVVAVALAPVTAVLIGHIHPLSPVVNLVVVPLVTFAVTPLALAGAFLPWVDPSGWLLIGADFGVHAMERMLASADRVAPKATPVQGWHMVLAGCLAALWLLPVSRTTAVGAAAGLALLLFVPNTAPVPFGEARITAFDVGQGTAVLVQTETRALLYDAGPSYLTGRDAGASVVVPALNHLGVGQLELLIASHGDTDHAGGVASVLRAVPVGAVLAGEPLPHVAAAAPCRAGLRWEWDGVTFSVLHPPAWGHVDRGTAHGHGDGAMKSNDASCVLLIETRAARALLPGDIERRVERGLKVPPLDFLLVAHHGSTTSTSEPFLAAARPRVAVVSAGFDNRFSHPHADVMERLRGASATIANTANSGAVQWSSVESGVLRRARCRGGPYWRVAATGACGP
ncbi:MAG: DNA internalization-related competence protein ComEC/Rec2 [Gammaproteobacteria bacterium]|nr:DNA internalization-related competence protein ComEC/Rec2 [Gammaproteobacteria bacterium]